MSNMQTQTTANSSYGLYFCNEREFAIGGHSKMIFANLKGPTLYEVGGVQLDPQAIGAGTKGKIVHVESRLADSGLYIVQMRHVGFLSSGAVEVRLVWTVRATGAEAAAIDLSAQLLTGIPVIFIP